MELAILIFIISGILTLIWLLNYDEHWYFAMFFVIASFVFLVTKTYIGQDCEDLGKFNSLNKIYQCEMVREKGKKQ
ncbi:hypothetical protein E2R48_00680 [Histophilus somni]|uniref:TMhelix containing protein n=1 Tax=Histophilus somni TaxID=731 RepID=A0AAX2S169_HISSO|nr:hypothetical protein [Histophilus somni]TEW31409.1 hypothetical protein E2R48_00680 [Histophilus somni]THA97457.1 hypothetical protein E6A58_00680 [Histophilus somni]